MSHEYKPVSPNEWTHTFECKLCHRRRQFIASAGMTSQKLNETDKVECSVKKPSITHSSHMGISLTTDVHTKFHSDTNMYEAKCGVAFLGSPMMTEKQLKAIHHNPFHDKFQDNFAGGFGSTQDEAISNLKDDLTEMSESLWRM